MEKDTRSPVLTAPRSSATMRHCPYGSTMLNIRRAMVRSPRTVPQDAIPTESTSEMIHTGSAASRSAGKTTTVAAAASSAWVRPAGVRRARARSSC
ncbi:hypothetical protein [Streptomyces sp. NBC_01320]|uniref:hypothetical protein n=1 Tax=Streptomyces sp. NBC_01320 TaxID=2903824 RepID=UPI002E0E23DE|nr:hypothetical protein OG395_19280 [Streptomyces sp. NBC_01320]